jgi:hypothetical protein
VPSAQFSFCIAKIQFVNWLDAGRKRKTPDHADGLVRKRQTEGKPMPLVDIELIEGVFDKEQKQEMIRRVTDAMVGIEGEAMRGVS